MGAVSKVCLFCAETIKAAAIKSMHFGEALDRGRKKLKPRGSAIGALFWLIIFFPVGIIYIQSRSWS